MNAALDGRRWPESRPGIVGVVHLPPLPGAPGYGGSLVEIDRRVASDAAALIAGGVDGLIVENFGDAPFFADRVPAITVSHMTRLAARVRAVAERHDFLGPIGVNVLRNDARAALAIAHAVDAHFIRVNVLHAARLTDQGLITGDAAGLLRERARLGAGHIAIWADVRVKHSTPVGPERPVGEEVADLFGRSGADAVIVTGAGTGRPTDPAELRAVREAAGERPVVVGSGATPQLLAELAPLIDAAIVGTWVKADGRVDQPVDKARVRELRGAV